ncbi:MAG: AI-2E family transporter [Rickettsiales bacterium]|jgi:predicted PurR-regulated permease PerM|nr:AI-2E family transporter [Rickettsiales bacterium]
MKASVNILALAAVIYILKAGAGIFLPFAVAAFIWMLIWLLDLQFGKIIDRLGLPRFTHKIARALSIVAICAAAYFIAAELAYNVRSAIDGFSKYQGNATVIAHKLSAYFNVNLDKYVDMGRMASQADVQYLLGGLLVGTTTAIRGIGMVVIYLIFMLLEENSLRRKIPVLFKNELKDKKIHSMIEKILQRVRTYLFIKTLSSVITAGLAYAVFRAAGLDYAVLFSILVFMLNYIPTIGSIVSAMPPITMSLLQFEGALEPFLIVSLGILAIQVLLGNIIEPRITGHSVDISPLVQIISLVLCGWMWGAVGMFLCMPMLIIAVIVLESVPRTRKLAVLLGNNEDKK